MNRRHVLGGIGSAAAAVSASPSAAQPSPELSWRLVSVAPHTQEIFYTALRRTTQAVSDLTGGKMRLQLFGPGEIVPALATFDAVQNDTVEIGWTASYFSVGKDPAFALGSSLPFGPNARIQRAWLHAGGLDFLNEFYKDYGVIMFPGGNTGAQMAGWFRKEIKGLDDLRGLKMRIAGLGGHIMSRLGVVPQQLATADVYPALERGTIDAVEVSGPFDDERFGFQRVAPYYYYPGFTEGNVELSFFLRLDRWNALPKQYQAALKAAFNLAADEILWRYDSEQTAPLRRLLAQGVQLRQMPTDIVDAARREALALYTEFSDKSPHFKRIYEHYRVFTRECYQWWQVSEYRYDSMVVRQMSQTP